jgi:hypothetical protein
MKLYRPGDRSCAICTRCGSVVPTTLSPRDVPFSNQSGSARYVPGTTCDDCGSVVAVPAQSVPAITTSFAAPYPQVGQDKRERDAEALHKRIMSLIEVTDVLEGVRIVQESKRVDSVPGGREALIRYLCGGTLVQIGNELRTSRTRARFALLNAAYEISDEIKELRFRSSPPSPLDNSILSRLSIRAFNSVTAMGLGTDEKVIIYLKTSGSDAFKGVNGIGQKTRGEILEAYNGLF